MYLETDSITILKDVRPVTYINGIKCVNCYYYKESPCNLCKNLNYSITLMNWIEFMSEVSHVFLNEKLTKIPDNYDEFCELYDIYHDLPDLYYE